LVTTLKSIVASCVLFQTISRYIPMKSSMYRLTIFPFCIGMSKRRGEALVKGMSLSNVSDSVMYLL